MPLREHVYSILIVSASEKFNAALRPLLPESDYDPVRFAVSVSEAQRLVQERSFDLVLVNTPLPDDFGRRLAVDISRREDSVAAMLVRGELYDETYARVFAQGVFTIRKPVSPALLLQSLDWMRTARERLRAMEKRTVSLEDKMAEIRLVNRAKWTLIEKRHMTEADAHRYIEKQAMDRCITRRAVAERILRPEE